MADGVLGASFRDPSGFVFSRGGVLYRQVNRVHAAHYERMMGSGLYRDLVARGLLIPHEESPEAAPHSANRDARRLPSNHSNRNSAASSVCGQS